jgi:phosphohistidine phosphatase
MELYVMQHGEASPEQDDPARPLTPAGRATVQKVASWARYSGALLDRCVHSGKLRAQQSGKLRAQQSAELLAAALGSGQVEARDGLAPNDPVAAVADWLRELPDSAVAVVGHLPFVDRLTSLLIVGDEAAGVVMFRMGGLVKLAS